MCLAPVSTTFQLCVVVVSVFAGRKRSTRGIQKTPKEPRPDIRHCKTVRHKTVSSTLNNGLESYSQL
jgi:hypothetical protein